ncbi:MAG: thiopurine S-methyltransferase [Pseudomonadota bacterium]
MEAGFWHERWATGRIAFHEGAPNALLERNLAALGLKTGARIFVPLCGKAVDLAWLAARGHDVVGAELDQRAVEAFFDEQSLTPEISSHGTLKRYRADAITIYQGDIFDLRAADIGEIDAVFDRAALVALPPDMRARYAPHLAAITAQAPQLLITFEYDNPAMQGPPHSVPFEEVAALYGDDFEIKIIERREIAGPLRQRTTGAEIAYHILARGGGMSDERAGP